MKNNVRYFFEDDGMQFIGRQNHAFFMISLNERSKVQVKEATVGGSANHGWRFSFLQICYFRMGQTYFSTIARVDSCCSALWLPVIVL